MQWMLIRALCHVWLRTGLFGRHDGFAGTLLEARLTVVALFSVDYVCLISLADRLLGANLDTSRAHRAVVSNHVRHSEKSSRSDFIIFSEPTRGLDVASAEFIYNKILKIRQTGVAILLISSNLDEIVRLADTLVVMYRGRVVACLANREELTKELIGEYMMGLRNDFKN